jgi:hypothetical protein
LLHEPRSGGQNARDYPAKLTKIVVPSHLKISPRAFSRISRLSVVKIQGKTFAQSTLAQDPEFGTRTALEKSKDYFRALKIQLGEGFTDAETKGFLTD